MNEHNARLPRLARRLTVIALLAATTLATPALACQNPSFAARKAAALTEPEAPILPAVGADNPRAGFVLETNGSPASIVGMWHTVLRIGNANGPVYDESLEQFHSDGTELLVSNGLPPALGNVCIGVWKRVGPRSYKLHHMTWNWAPEDGGFGVPGTFVGHFELDMVLDLDPNGRTFRGRWSAKNFDTAGAHIPALDAEGAVRGVRLTID
jgi:hypothetical protein